MNRTNQPRGNSIYNILLDVVYGILVVFIVYWRFSSFDAIDNSRNKCAHCSPSAYECSSIHFQREKHNACYEHGHGQQREYAVVNFRHQFSAFRSLSKIFLISELPSISALSESSAILNILSAAPGRTCSYLLNSFADGSGPEVISMWDIEIRRLFTAVAP